MPPSLASRPKLTPWQQSFMDCFNTTSGSRQYTSAGSAEIPYPVIILWMNEHNITDLSDREEFVAIVQAIDKEYLNHVNKKP